MNRSMRASSTIFYFCYVIQILKIHNMFERSDENPYNNSIDELAKYWNSYEPRN